MARSRYLKASFYEHDGIGELSRDARSLFMALWCLADREGRLLDRPKRIRGFAYRFDDDVTDEMVDGWLQELHNHPDEFVTRYEVSGEKYLQINGFSEHQSPHPKEASNDYPPPPDDVPRGEPCNYRASPEITGPVTESSGRSPVPSSHTPLSTINNPQSKKERAHAHDGFDAFWAAYPNRRDRKAALRAWAKIRPDPALLARMLAAIEREKQSDQWRRGIIPHPATWLNGERWEDEPPPALAAGAAPSTSGMSAAEKTMAVAHRGLERARERDRQREAAGGGA